mmetsp:Transcript_9324/g.8776  ORF Transcript_9324/g.8776 Transcript_9324/m.8776 type:complete len:96 (+) Transcript_9324:343-630(+)
MCSKNDSFVHIFWDTLKSMTEYQKKQFLIFAWGRTRTGNYYQPKMNFEPLEFNENNYIPVSHSTTFRMQVPRYPTTEDCREGLNIAISYFKVINY